MIEPKKYKCKSCELIFFKHSNNNLKKNKKGLTCPYCGSESWIPLTTK